MGSRCVRSEVSDAITICVINGVLTRFDSRTNGTPSASASTIRSGVDAIAFTVLATNCGHTPAEWTATAHAAKLAQ